MIKESILPKIITFDLITIPHDDLKIRRNIQLISSSPSQVSALTSIAIGTTTSHSGQWTWTAPTPAMPADPRPAACPYARPARRAIAATASAISLSPLLLLHPRCAL